uniref:Uncharacterized protein n=1 Tax=Hordeum vulgare subsp. vulgare TaxID=112509 RepID=A0A8I6XZR0_HORVV
MRTKTAFFNRTKFIIGNGEFTRFWEDTWLGDEPLALQYPQLYILPSADRRPLRQCYVRLLLTFSFADP